MLQKTILLSIFAFVISVQASEKSTVNWSNLDIQQYFEQQIACLLKVKEQQWDNTIWPKENKTPKPLFADRIQ